MTVQCIGCKSFSVTPAGAALGKGERNPMAALGLGRCRHTTDRAVSFSARFVRICTRYDAVAEAELQRRRSYMDKQAQK